MKTYIKTKGLCKVVCIVAMPNLTEKEYCGFGLHGVCGLERVITQEWFSSEEEFSRRFKRAVEIAFERVGGTRLDKDYYDRALVLVSNKKLRELENNGDVEFCAENLESDGVDVTDNTSQATLDWDVAVINAVEGNNNIVEDNKSIGDYSRLYLIDGHDNELDVIERVKSALLMRGNSGTKVVFLFINIEENLKQKICNVVMNVVEKDGVTKKDDIEELEKLKIGYINDWITFLCEIHFLDRKIIEKNNVNKENTSKYVEIICEQAPVIVKDIRDSYQYSSNGINIIKLKQKIEKLLELDEKDKIYWQTLECFSKLSSFNLEQFIVEHYNPKEDLIITAGAGTGKTFSMVGRIAFLVYMNILTIDQSQEKKLKISDMIYMMTFTNNSTNEMRERLSKHYEKYFVLTHKLIYMDLVKQIGGMTIKTIDSMAKLTLGRYAHLLGLSSNFKIGSGVYIKNQIIRQCVQEQYIKDAGQQEWIDDHQLRTYELEAIVKRIMEYLAQRGIYLDNNQVQLANSIGGSNSFKEFLGKVVRESIDQYHQYCIDNDTLEMENIVTWLSEIKSSIKFSNKVDIDSRCIRYLFIDEFQDTDNHQIELIAFFADLYNLTLFVVGDKKQGIYGFRGANDSAFQNLEQKCKCYNKTFKTLELKKNYRTDIMLMNQLNVQFDKWPKEHFKYNEEDVLIPQVNKRPPNTKVEEIYYGESIKNEKEVEEKLDKYINILKMRLQNHPIEKNKIEKIAILVRTNEQIDKIRAMNAKNKWGVEFDTSGVLYRQDAIIDFYKMVCALLNKNNAKQAYNLSQTPYVTYYIPKNRFYYKASNAIKNIDDLDREINNSGFSFKKYIDKISQQSALKLLKELIKENKPWLRYVPEKLQDKWHNNQLSTEDYCELEIERDFYRKCLEQLFQILIENNGTEYITVNQVKDILNIWITTWQKRDLFEDLREKNLHSYFTYFKSINLEKIMIINEKDEEEVYELEELWNEVNLEKNRDIINRSIELKEIDIQHKTVKVKYRTNIKIICTTIHKSKGLEYRAVILPYTTTDIGQVSGKYQLIDDVQKNGSIEYRLKKKDIDGKYRKFYESDKFEDLLKDQVNTQVSEELRNLYVALTRAKNELYYIVNEEEMNKLGSNKEYWAKYLN